jgi:threonine aldolase
MPHEPVDLRSDTVTRPSPGMRKAIYEAVVGDDVFEDDPTVQRLEGLVADMTGREASLLVPSGTMGNEIAILVHCQRTDEAIVEFDSHIYNYETAGPAALSGVQLAPIKTESGLLSQQEIDEAIRPDDVHEPVTRLLCVENTHNRKGGVAYPLDAFGPIADYARGRGLKVHLDGARIFNASAASGTTLKDYFGASDSVMFCLSKGLGAPIGSMLVGDRDFILAARRYRKLLGGGMRQAGVIAAAGIYALTNNIERLPEDHRRARLLAEALAGIETLDIDLDSVQTNIVVIDIARTGRSLEECLIALEKEGVLVVPFGRTLLRAVTHLDIDDKDVETAISVFNKLFSTS